MLKSSVKNHNMNVKTHNWYIKKRVEETPGVFSLYLCSKNGKRPEFIAGQYVTIMLPYKIPEEGKAYSISSSPLDEDIRITIRTMGDFSESITRLDVGSEIITTYPYGFFYPEIEETETIVFMSAGIGITPCMSIITNETMRKSKRTYYLFYSNQTIKDTVFYNEIESLKEKNQNLHVYYHITREKALSDFFCQGRIDSQTAVDIVGDERAEYFLCGSMSFTKDMWKALRSVDVPEFQIYTEGFF